MITSRLSIRWHQEICPKNISNTQNILNIRWKCWIKKKKKQEDKCASSDINEDADLIPDKYKIKRFTENESKYADYKPILCSTKVKNTCDIYISILGSVITEQKRKQMRSSTNVKTLHDPETYIYILDVDLKKKIGSIN